MKCCLDKYGQRTFIDDADAFETYFCPECGEKMVQKRGEILAHHFAHHPNTQCTDVWRYDESDWHDKFQSLFPKENQEIVKELDGKKHRADILFEERKLVIELQGEWLRQDEFERRNQFFTALGYKVIWIFDQSRVFEAKSIDYGNRRKPSNREWIRPSRTFKAFSPQTQAKEVEVWFQRSESESEDEPRFFQILKSYNHLKTMECGFCHSLKELLRYLKDGQKTIDYSALYDEKYLIRRSDGSNSIYHCPRRPLDPFVSIDTCFHCPFNEELWFEGDPHETGCTYRFEQMEWGYDGEISACSMREDGFVESITIVNSYGEATVIDLECPKTFLRSLIELWKRYSPLKRLVAFNAKTKEIFSVFNPIWQKTNKGQIKGRRRSPRGYYAKGPEEIVPNAEEPIWFVVDTVKTE